MSFEGKWTIKTAMVFDENGARQLPVEEIIGTPAEELYEGMLSSFVIITPTSMDTYISLPEEQYEAAKAEGIEINEYGARVESREIQERDGEFYYDSGTEGEVAGEKLDRFVKLELDEDGLLPIAGGMFRLQKEA